MFPKLSLFQTMLRPCQGLTIAALCLGLASPTVATPKIDSITPRNRTNSPVGRVWLKRPGWQNYRPISSGTTLQRGDLLRVDRGLRVRLHCGDRQRSVTVPTRTPTSLETLCPRWQAVRGRGQPDGATIGGIDATLPYVITPRHSLLITDRPTLRWKPVPGASRYQVQVVSPAGILWQQSVTTSQIRYPGTPPLQPGIAYKLVVKTDAGRSSEEDTTSPPNFRLLFPQDIASIQKDLRQVTNAQLSPLLTTLELVDLYRNYQLPESAHERYGLSAETAKLYTLNHEAIVTLEAWIKQKGQSTLTLRALGSLYWQNGLVQPAIDAYTAVADQVQGEEDLEDWAIAQYSLGELYSTLGQPELARLWFQQARVSYVLLGDDNRAMLIQQQLLQSQSYSR